MLVPSLTVLQDTAQAAADTATGTELGQRGRTLAQLLNSVGAVVLGTVALLMALNVFIEIGPLLAGAGLVGLAISFGAQGLVRDVISGFFVLLENQFGVGDLVQIGDVAGTVERMTLRVVMIRDIQGVLHIVPNGHIGIVSNRSRSWSRTVLDVGVGYLAIRKAWTA